MVGVCLGTGPNECTGNLVRNPQRQSAIREFKTRDETPYSPSRWLPTLPSTSSPATKQKRRVESPRPQVARWLRLQIMTRDINFFVL